MVVFAVTEHLPDATIVFDIFHALWRARRQGETVKLMNEKLTQLRHDLHRVAVDQLDKVVLKGTRWLLMKNPNHLDDDQNEPARLQEALALNQPLATAYDNIRAVVFSDFGTVEETAGVEQFRASVGAGLRLIVPAMGPAPIALDFAVPLVKEDFDERQVFSFYIGFTR